MHTRILQSVHHLLTFVITSLLVCGVKLSVLLRLKITIKQYMFSLLVKKHKASELIQCKTCSLWDLQVRCKQYLYIFLHSLVQFSVYFWKSHTYKNPISCWFILQTCTFTDWPLDHKRRLYSNDCFVAFSHFNQYVTWLRYLIPRSYHMTLVTYP